MTLPPAPALPPAPTLGAAARDAVTDLYYNSWRLVPLNAAWGLGFGGLFLLFMGWPIAALVAAPILAVPTAVLFRVAALIERGEAVSVATGLRGWRRLACTALATSCVAVAVAATLIADLIGGLGSANPAGWIVAAFAVWGLLCEGLWLVSFWPLFVDPARTGLGWRRTARLAVYLALARPIRLAGLAAFIAVVLAASTVLVAPLVSVSIGYVALVSCRYVLPAADRLEARLVVPGVHRAPGMADDEALGQPAPTRAGTGEG